MRFDVILPSIGRPSLLNAIDSVLRQEHTDWNLWVICDGLSRLEEIINDDRVIVVPSDIPAHHDFGAWARNAGVAKGSNPWIAYLDDDDVWLTNHLSTFQDLLSRHPDATMMRTSGRSFSWRRKSPRSKERVRKLGTVNDTDILTVGMAHTRELFKSTAGWLPCDNHDKLLWHEMLCAGGKALVWPAVTFEFER